MLRRFYSSNTVEYNRYMRVFANAYQRQMTEFMEEYKKNLTKSVKEVNTNMHARVYHLERSIAHGHQKHIVSNHITDVELGAYDNMKKLEQNIYESVVALENGIHSSTKEFIKHMRQGVAKEE